MFLKVILLAVISLSFASADTPHGGVGHGLGLYYDYKDRPDYHPEPVHLPKIVVPEPHKPDTPSYGNAHHQYAYNPTPYNSHPPAHELAYPPPIHHEPAYHHPSPYHPEPVYPSPVYHDPSYHHAEPVYHEPAYGYEPHHPVHLAPVHPGPIHVPLYPVHA